MVIFHWRISLSQVQMTQHLGLQAFKPCQVEASNHLKTQTSVTCSPIEAACKHWVSSSAWNTSHASSNTCQLNMEWIKCTSEDIPILFYRFQVTIQGWNEFDSFLSRNNLSSKHCLSARIRSTTFTKDCMNDLYRPSHRCLGGAYMIPVSGSLPPPNVMTLSTVPIAPMTIWRQPCCRI